MTTIAEMINAARDVALRAYAPYSKFFVGACIKAASGQLYLGCNVENASFGATNCAEACAIANMVSHGEQSILEIAIIGLSSKDMITPCGICLQRLREFSNPKTMLIHAACQKGTTITYRLEELLPHSFGPHYLENLS